MTQRPSIRNLSAKTRWAFWGAIAAALVWCGLFLTHPLWPTDVVPLESELNGPRWFLLLVPDQTVGSWFDGPVTVAGFLQRTAVLAVALVLIGTAAVAGWWVVRAMPPLADSSRLERVALGAVCGLMLQSWVTAIVGLFGGVGRLGSGPLIVLVTLGTGYAAGRLGRRFGQSEKEFSPAAAPPNGERPATEAPPRWAKWIPFSLFVVLASLLVARSMMPPAEYDVREYHLQAPKEWSLAGQITFMPHNIYANMPMAAEMHVLLAIDSWRWFGDESGFWWWGALSGKLVMASYAILGAVLLGQVVRRLRGPLAGYWTSVLAVSMPALVEGASLGLVEAAVACFFAAGLWFVVVVRQSEREGLMLRSAGWVGFFAGAAMACKYPALLFVALPLGIACWFIGTERAWPAKSLRLVCFVLLASLACAPWYVKNAVLAGNPVYPLAASIFGGETMSPAKIAQWNEAHQHDGFGADDLFASVKRLSWQWQTQSIVLYPLALIGAVATWWEKPTRWALAALAMSLLMWWLFTHRIERFLVPSLPLVFVLAGLGWSSLREHFGVRVVTVVALIGVGMDAMLVASPLLGDSRLAVELATLRRDEPVGERVSRLPEHVRYVNDELGPTDHLLLVGDAAAFDYAVPVDYSTTFDESPLARVLAMHPSDAWGSALRRQGYTHVLMHWAEIERLRSTYGFDPRITREQLAEMREVGALVLERADLTEGVVELYRVADGKRGAGL